MQVSQRSCVMENGSLHPSIYVKMLGKQFPSIQKFQKYDASSAGVCGILAYVNGASRSLFRPTCHGSTSPMSPVFMGAPSEKRSDDIFAKIYALQIWLASKTVIAPIERVKLLTQCQNEMIKSGRLSHPYKGIGDCFARTIRNEGVISLWRGNTAHILEKLSSRYITFALNNCIGSSSKNEDKDGFKKSLAAQSLVFATVQFLVHPLEYAQTRLANDISAGSSVKKGQFKGIIDVFKKTLKSDGIVGLYRGYNITLYKIFAAQLLTLATNTALVPFASLGLALLGLQHYPLARSMARFGLEICVYFPTYAMDTVRRRMMMRSGEAVKYKNWLHAFSQIHKNEGVKSFYKGAGVGFLIPPLAFGVSMLLLELSFKIWPVEKYRSGKSGQPDTSFTIKWKKSGGNDSH